jgi:hypothetical protein
LPSSHYLQLNEIVDLVVRTRPEKVLDIGIGFGKYGFLAREYLELWEEGAEYGKWKRQIDGIEAFEQYITPLHRHIYSEIFSGNALDILPGMKDSYDLILLIDVIEHFTREEGIRVLEECRRLGKYVVVATPKAMNPQEEVFGNSFETHKYQWKKQDFFLFPEYAVLKNPKSLIVLAGGGSREICRGIIREKRRTACIGFLEILGLKNVLKKVLGR